MSQKINARFQAPLRNDKYTKELRMYEGCQKVKQYICFPGAILLVKYVLRAAAFKCPAFIHIVARFLARVLKWKHWVMLEF